MFNNQRTNPFALTNFSAGASRAAVQDIQEALQYLEDQQQELEANQNVLQTQQTQLSTTVSTVQNTLQQVQTGSASVTIPQSIYDRLSLLESKMAAVEASSLAQSTEQAQLVETVQLIFDAEQNSIENLTYLLSNHVLPETVTAIQQAAYTAGQVQTTHTVQLAAVQTLLATTIVDVTTLKNDTQVASLNQQVFNLAGRISNLELANQNGITEAQLVLLLQQLQTDINTRLRISDYTPWKTSIDTWKGLIDEWKITVDNGTATGTVTKSYVDQQILNVQNGVDQCVKTGPYTTWKYSIDNWKTTTDTSISQINAKDYSQDVTLAIHGGYFTENDNRHIEFHNRINNTYLAATQGFNLAKSAYLLTQDFRSKRFVYPFSFVIGDVRSSVDGILNYDDQIISTIEQLNQGTGSEVVYRVNFTANFSSYVANNYFVLLQLRSTRTNPAFSSNDNDLSIPVVSWLQTGSFGIHLEETATSSQSVMMDGVIVLLRDTFPIVTETSTLISQV